MFASGNKVAARWTSVGTHKGELMSVSATEREVTISGIDVVRVEGRKIAELWHQVDVLGMLQQVGAVDLRRARPEDLVHEQQTRSFRSSR